MKYKPKSSDQMRTSNHCREAANKPFDCDLKHAEDDSLYKQRDLGLCKQNGIGEAYDKRLASKWELKYDEEGLDNCYQRDEVMVVLDAPLDVVTKMDAIMKGLLGSLKKTKPDSYSVNNEG